MMIEEEMPFSFVDTSIGLTHESPQKQSGGGRAMQASPSVASVTQSRIPSVGQIHRHSNNPMQVV
jgi:hypothetical protein